MNQILMDLINKMFDSDKNVNEMSDDEIIENFGDCDMKQLSKYNSERLERFKDIDNNLALEKQKEVAELQTLTIAEYGADYEQTLKEVKQFNNTVRNMKKQTFEYSSED